MVRSTKWPNVRVFHRRRGPGPPACEKFRVFDTRVSLRDPRHGFCRRVGAGQRSRYFTRTKNERQTRRLGWGSLLSRSNRCKRTSGAAAAAGGGHFSQHSVKLPPQGQVSGEIGPRALGNGGFPGFKVRIRRGRGGQSQLTGLANPPIPGIPERYISQAHSLSACPCPNGAAAGRNAFRGGRTPSKPTRGAFARAGQPLLINTGRG